MFFALSSRIKCALDFHKFILEAPFIWQKITKIKLYKNEAQYENF